MILFNATSRRACALSDDKLTTGSVGIQVEFTFSDDWAAAPARIAVFRGSGVSVDVTLLEDSCTVPPEVLTQPGSTLTIGVYGTDGAGTVVIPTVYAEAGQIKRGAEPSGIEPTPQTQPLIDQLLAAAQAARNAADEAERLAQSIRDDADAGEFDGQNGADGNSLWWTVSLIDDESMEGQVYGKILSSWLKGRSGVPAVHDLVVGPAVGTSRSIGWLYEIIAVSGIYCNLHGVGSIKGAPGDPGADGYAPEVTIETITGGHRITITSAAHPDGQSFDVMDGTGGGVTVDDALSGSSTNPVQNKVVKAALDGKGTYSKPASGIPKTDMAEDVQTSLAKANTALQKHQSLTAYRTAQAQDTIDQQQNTAIAAKYTKPSSGIPASDLAEDAQRGYTSEERVTLVPEGTYTFSADAGDGAGYAYGLDFSSVPDMDFDSPPESVMIVVDGVEYEKQYNASESESSGYTAAIYGTTDIPTNDCALIIELNLLRQGITEEAITPIVRLNVIEGEEQHTLSAYFIRQPVTTTPDFDAAVAKSSAEALAEKLDTDGDAYRAASIPMGQLDSTSTATVMTAQVDGITELRDGVCVWLRNGVIASASGVTLDINGLGAKPIYNSLSGAIVTTTFATASTYLFVYNSTRVTGGCWDMVYGYDANTTYTPVKLGFGYATCSTAASTTAKTAALSSYTLTTGGIVAVKFTNAVPAGATLNINSKGAKAIYYKGAAITADVIKAGDTVTMIYSTYYHVLSIDRTPQPGDAIAADVTSNYSSSGFSNEYARVDHVHRLDVSVFETILDNVFAVNMPVILYDGNNNGVVIQESPQTIMNIYQHQPKQNFALIVPPDKQNYPVIFTASSLNTTTGETHLTGITGGVLYEATLFPGLDPIDNDGFAMVGTMTTTNLALPSATGVSF